MAKLPAPQAGTLPESAQAGSERMGVQPAPTASLPERFSHEQIADTPTARGWAPVHDGGASQDAASPGSSPAPANATLPERITPHEVADNADRYGMNSAKAWSKP